MFHDNITRLLKELKRGDAALVDRHDPSFRLSLEGTEIILTDDPPGVHFFAVVAQLPEENQEKICQKILRGNFLGQSTRKGYLGLGDDEKSIIAQAQIPMIRSYQEFYENLEDFVNVVSFWKKEALVV